MRRDRNRRVAVLSDASFAPLDPLRHPPQGVSVHSHNDGGDTGGRGHDPVMDGLVAELGGGGRALHHDRFGSSSHVQQNGLLVHPQDLDVPLRLAAQRKINSYRQPYADNQNISFLPAIVSTSTRMHGEFLRLLFLQAHPETEAHFTTAGMLSQRNQSDSFRFKRAAFYQS
jgi:hypothetical protein